MLFCELICSYYRYALSLIVQPLTSVLRTKIALIVIMLDIRIRVSSKNRVYESL